MMDVTNSPGTTTPKETKKKLTLKKKRNRVKPDGRSARTAGFKPPSPPLFDASTPTTSVWSTTSLQHASKLQTPEQQLDRLADRFQGLSSSDEEDTSLARHASPIKAVASSQPHQCPACRGQFPSDLYSAHVDQCIQRTDPSAEAVGEVISVKCPACEQMFAPDLINEHANTCLDQLGGTANNSPVQGRARSESAAQASEPMAKQVSRNCLLFLVVRRSKHQHLPRHNQNIKPVSSVVKSSLEPLTCGVVPIVITTNHNF